MRYGSVLSGNVFATGPVTVSVLNSPGASVIVASQVGNTVGFGGGFGFGGGVAASPLAYDLRGFPGL
jgi:hypothetical protein